MQMCNRRNARTSERLTVALRFSPSGIETIPLSMYPTKRVISSKDSDVPNQSSFSMKQSAKEMDSMGEFCSDEVCKWRMSKSLIRKAIDVSSIETVDEKFLPDEEVHQREIELSAEKGSVKNFGENSSMEKGGQFYDDLNNLNGIIDEEISDPCLTECGNSVDSGENDEGKTSSNFDSMEAVEPIKESISDLGKEAVHFAAEIYENHLLDDEALMLTRNENDRELDTNEDDQDVNCIRKSQMELNGCHSLGQHSDVFVGNVKNENKDSKVSANNIYTLNVDSSMIDHQISSNFYSDTSPDLPPLQSPGFDFLPLANSIDNRHVSDASDMSVTWISPQDLRFTRMILKLGRAHDLIDPRGRRRMVSLYVL